MEQSLMEQVPPGLADPLIDRLMVGASAAGLLLLLALPALLRRRTLLVRALLGALGGSLLLAVALQLAIDRPWPAAAWRVLVLPDGWASYPSGVASVFSAATLVLALARHRLWPVLLLLTLGQFSGRLGLDQARPSDLIAGVLVGAAVGLAVSRALVEPDWPRRLRWGIAPQAAVAAVVSLGAYLRILPLHRLPPDGDKLLHFLLIGSLAFWTTCWWPERRLGRGRLSVPLAVVLPFVPVALEELLQLLSPARSADWLDLGCDLLGLLFFRWLARRVLTLLGRASPPA